MQAGAPRLLLSVAAGAALVGACGGRRLPGPAAEVPATELVVLLPDSETGAVGRARVSTPQGSVDLTAAHAATSVAAGAAPGPVDTLSQADVDRIFGSALAALPLPPLHFTLHFRFESDRLTDEALALLPKILQNVKERAVPDVLVVGHTDTAGSADANLALGLMRAMAIRDLLVQAGLNPSAIDVLSTGERDLLVRTADGTPEPRNRRVEIAVR